jgi:hypothetical protein
MNTTHSADDVKAMVQMIKNMRAPLKDNLSIKIRGDPADLSEFLKYVKSNHEFFTSLGFETPTFIVDGENGCLITSDDFELQLDYIMAEYI